MTAAAVTAFCPGHISGYFRRIEGGTPAETGSIGAGIVIEEGVKVTVRPAAAMSVTVTQLIGGRERVSRSSPPVLYALERIGASVSVSTECTLPISAGFGLSAAALLATLAATDRLLDLGLSPHDIAGIAHETEVIHRTGLGDVAACQGGGRVVRQGAGIDGPIERFFDIPGTLSAVSFGPIHTPYVLGSRGQMDHVAAAFPEGRPASVREFFAFSRRFTDRSGLATPEVHRVLSTCDTAGVPASMTMLGNGIFACGPRARKLLSRFGTVYDLHMASGGTRILEVVP